MKKIEQEIADLKKRVEAQEKRVKTAYSLDRGVVIEINENFEKIQAILLDISAETAVLLEKHAKDKQLGSKWFGETSQAIREISDPTPSIDRETYTSKKSEFVSDNFGMVEPNKEEYHEWQRGDFGERGGIYSKCKKCGMVLGGDCPQPSTGCKLNKEEPTSMDWENQLNNYFSSTEWTDPMYMSDDKLKQFIRETIQNHEKYLGAKYFDDPTYFYERNLEE